MDEHVYDYLYENKTMPMRLPMTSSCGTVCLLEDGLYLGTVVLDSPGKLAHRVDHN